MTYMQRINRRQRIREIICNTVVYSIVAFIIFCLLFCLLWFTIGTHEVKTYSFLAEITDKAVTDKYRSNTEYHIFWRNDEEAGSDRVSASTYARYGIGDLIEVEVVVEQDWFGNEFVTYRLTEN